VCIQLDQVCGIAYAQSAEITTTIGVHRTGLEQRLARFFWWAFAARGVPASFDNRRARGGGNECGEGKSKDKSGFKELHGCWSENAGMKWE
jgi:hypothetical protein